MYGVVPLTALLDRVESKAFCLINFSPLTDCLQPLSLRRNVASLTVFYRYFHPNCSIDLANRMYDIKPKNTLKALQNTAKTR